MECGTRSGILRNWQPILVTWRWCGRHRKGFFTAGTINHASWRPDGTNSVDNQVKNLSGDKAGWEGQSADFIAYSLFRFTIDRSWKRLRIYPLILQGSLGSSKIETYFSSVIRSMESRRSLTRIMKKDSAPCLSYRTIHEIYTHSFRPYPCLLAYCTRQCFTAVIKMVPLVPL